MLKNQSNNNFSGGEWSPFLDGRDDLQKYSSACSVMQNFRPLPWGGATFRQGTEFFGFAKQNSPVRLIPFNYSTTLSYVLELGGNYMRFWNSNGTPVLNAGTPVEIVTPWKQSQLPAIQFKQINAQIRFVHPSVAPQTLTYTSAIAWSIATTAFKYPALLNQNAVQANTLAVSALSGAGVTMTASVPTFNSSHVGSYWELQQLRAASSSILDLNNQTTGAPVFTTPLQVQGDWTFSTSQFWWGDVQVQRSEDGGATYTVIRDFTAKSDQNYSTSGTESAPNIGAPPILYRIAYTKAGAPFDSSIWTGSAPTEYAFAQASLEAQDAYISGLVLVTGYTDTTHLTVTIILPPVATTATYLWSEGAFSAFRGYPTCVAFYEQRLLYSGVATLPNNVFGSVTGDFDNFQYSANDDGAVSFQPAVCQQNQAVWLASLLRVHVGTSGEEIIMASGNLDEALSPTNITMRAQSYYGSAPIQPLLLQNTILFVERNGLRVREMRELSPYVVPTDFVAPDLTLMSEHITQPGIVQMDFGRLPDPLVYFIRSDGVMPVMTYNREQNINAWARYVTQGNFVSVACIYGSPADIVFVAVTRSLAGSQRCCVEGFTTDAAQYPDINLNLMLDCGAQFVAGVPNLTTGTTMASGATSVTGLTYLANQAVTAVIDGAEYAGLTVTSGGVLNFPAGVTSLIATNVGLPYVGQLGTMKNELQDEEGTSQGRKRRVSEVVVRVRNSRSLEYGGDEPPTQFRLLQFRSPNDQQGQASQLLAGVTDLPLPGPWPGGQDFAGNVTLQQSHPFALTVLGIFVKFNVF